MPRTRVFKYVPVRDEVECDCLPQWERTIEEHLLHINEHAARWDDEAGKWEGDTFLYRCPWCYTLDESYPRHVLKCKGERRILWNGWGTDQGHKPPDRTPEDHEYWEEKYRDKYSRKALGLD